MTAPLTHIMDDDARAKMTAALEQAAAVYLERDIWRGHWRVEIDGCVYKFKIEGYPKWGTPRWKKREDERAALMAEFERSQK